MNVLLCSIDHFERVNRERLKFFNRLVKKSDFHFSLLWLLHGNRIIVEKTGRQETIQEVVALKGSDDTAIGQASMEMERCG